MAAEADIIPKMENQSKNRINCLKCGLCDYYVQSSEKAYLVEHFKSAHAIKEEQVKCEVDPFEASITQDVKIEDKAAHIEDKFKSAHFH